MGLVTLYSSPHPNLPLLLHQDSLRPGGVGIGGRGWGTDRERRSGEWERKGPPGPSTSNCGSVRLSTPTGSGTTRTRTPQGDEDFLQDPSSTETTNQGFNFYERQTGIFFTLLLPRDVPVETN